MVSPTDLNTALREEQVRQHLRVLPASMGASACMGAVLVTVLWPLVPNTDTLLFWLAGLGLALVLRLGIGWTQRREQRAGKAWPQRWLRGHRVAFLLHGIAWSALPLVLGDAPKPYAAELMLFGLVAVAAGSLITAAFDLIAAVGFASLPVLSAVATALRVPEGSALALLALALVFIVLAARAARRGQHAVRSGVRLRLTAAQRAGEARHSSERADIADQRLAQQNQMLHQLLQTTRQGYWFIDNDGRTTELNPAMAALLGCPRDAVLGRSVYDFVDGADLQQLQGQLQARARGEPGHYELSLRRPDGSRMPCSCSATVLYGADGTKTGSIGVWTDISERRRGEAALRIYELAVNSITDLVAVVTVDEVYVLVNDAWCRATGVPRERAVGQRSIVALPTGVTADRRRALRESVEHFERRSARGALDTPGMEGRELETTYFPYRGEDGAVAFVVMVTRDITEQERSRAALVAGEAELRALLAAFPGYIAAVNGRGEYTYVNERLSAVLRRAPQDLVGRTPEQVLTPARVAVIDQELARARAGLPAVNETAYTLPDGRHVTLEVNYVASSPQADGGQNCYAFGVDITARKQAEEALIAARDEAQRANRAKSQFLAQMSHELRTPLNAIMGFGQLLALEPHAGMVQQQAWTHEILHGAEHLLSLINDILDLGRIEADELQLDAQPLALDTLMDECLGLVRPLAQQHDVRLLDLPLGLQGMVLKADRRRLKQVLLNLLGNAIKYNRPGGEVALQVRPENTQLWLAVRDSGPGITAAEQQRLFQPFERLGAAHSGIEGTGIGLALCRRLVSAMGGSIGVQSQPGAGSTFWFRLPRGDSGVAADGASVPGTPDGRPASAEHTVLYIEDNTVNVVLMEAMLARLPGVKLVSAALPSEGLRLATEQAPALVLLDIHLPEMDGFAVLQRLREQPATAHTPVVAVSANALQSDIDAALAAGFTAYMTKPLALETLLATVQRLLPRH